MERTFTPKRLVLLAGAVSIDEFQRLAETAKASGFTHVDIGALTEKSRHQLMNDGEYCPGYDFYPEYTARFPGFFKFHVPEALASTVPADYAKKNLEALAERGSIAAQAGLRGAFFGCEPQFLPESVYEAHQDWRGPRCDHLFRSLTPCFAPCIDNPDVLELYRIASRSIVDAAPILDTFGLLANDSGAGICWSPDLYAGENGPSGCRDVPMPERVAGFMEAVSCGTNSAGTSPVVYVYHIGIWSYSGCVPLIGANDGSRLAFCRPPLDKPIACENPLSMLTELETAAQADCDTVVFAIEGAAAFSKNSVYPALAARFRQQPSANLIERLAILREALGDALSEPGIDWMLNSWVHLDRALDEFKKLFKQSFFFYLSVSERWLTRPLVAFPLELTEDERSYYEAHVWNVLGEDVGGDLLDLHGSRWGEILQMPAEARRVERTCTLIMEGLNTAVGSARKVLGTKPGAEMEAHLEDTLCRLQGLECLVRNFNNVIQFQVQMDLAKDGGRINSGDHVLVANIMRDEVDNTRELIRLLETSRQPLITLAATARDEDTFTMSPDLVGQLEKKIAIMLKHWRDPERLYLARPGYV